MMELLKNYRQPIFMKWFWRFLMAMAALNAIMFAAKGYYAPAIQHVVMGLFIHRITMLEQYITAVNEAKSK